VYKPLTLLLVISFWTNSGKDIESRFKEEFKEIKRSKSNSRVIVSSTLIIKKSLGISIPKSLKGKDMLP
jgi:hypothetical protein